MHFMLSNNHHHTTSYQPQNEDDASYDYDCGLNESFHHNEQNADDEATFHIYNELQYAHQEQPQFPTQQQLSPATNDLQTIGIPIQPTPVNHNQYPSTGIIYGFRTRHLSCIEENDSDSFHSSSVPQVYELMQHVDANFKEVTMTMTESGNGQTQENDDEAMATIDETRLYDGDYLDELSVSKLVEAQLDVSYGSQNSEEYWQSGPPGNVDIMTTSCYGALNTSFESETSGPPGYMETSTPVKQQQKQEAQQQSEPLYATPEKRRELNRSFDSQSSFGAGNGNMGMSLGALSLCYAEQQWVNGDNSLPMDWSGLSLKGPQGPSWKMSGFGAPSAAEELSEETAVKCLSAAQNDLQSIRRLLEHDASGTICPSCRISFDKGKRRKLIDTCGHERCYSCMFRNDQCPMCMNSNSSLKDVDCNSNAQGYDTGIGGSTSTIVSPLGSPQPQLRSQVQRTNAAALARYIQHNRQDSISPDYHRYASIGKLPKAVAASSSTVAAAAAAANATTYTVTADIHHNTNSSSSSSAISSNKNHHTGSSSSNHAAMRYNNNNSNNNEINASSFATPPTRRRFFNHKNFRSALTGGHRRTASNGGCPSDTTSASLLSEAHDVNANECLYSSVEKQRDQLRTRLGLLLDNDQNGNNLHTTTTSSSSSQNISPEQTLASACIERQFNAPNFGSQLSVAPKADDTISLSSKLNAFSLNDNSSEGFPVKARKSVARRSARVGQTSAAASKRNAIYKPATSLPQLALKPLFFEVPLQEPDPPFIGRQWLLRELSNVLSYTETPGVLINGHPGTGKTALILQLVEYSCFGRRKMANTANDPDGIYCQINVGHERMRALASHIVGYHFCQADSNLTCLVPDFVHSLAAQLCQAPQLEAYREYLLSEPHLQDILSVKECIADAERVMRMAILEPLIALKQAGKINAKTCIILVDALCEAEYHRPDHGHTIATFLAKMTQHFPSWLKVVATIRTQMLEFVKGLSLTKMTLDSWASNDLLQKDMLDYITFRVNHSSEIQNNIAAIKDHNTGPQKFIVHLQSLTKGSMLYAKLILDLIERGQLVIKSTSYKVLPVSLAQIFLLHFNLRFPTTSSFEKAAEILNVCLAALYPLTLNEIYYTICSLKADEVLSWDEFLQRFQQLDGFLIKRIDNTYMFFHSYFREWLIRRDEGESSKFLCDFRLGHAAIAFRLSRLQAPLDPEQTLELGHHMLKAHIYRNCQGPQLPRDMQAFWVASVTDNISAALGSLRNVYSPNLKVSRLILLAGASPHYRTEFMGDATILCIAAHEGIVPMVSLLLEFGADVSLTNSQGCTPLILAAMRGHCDVVRLLVAAGSSLGQTDTTQRCALVHAARMGRLNVVKYLLACDWTPRTGSHDVSLFMALQQALIAAAAQDHVSILEDLLEFDGIDLNRVDPASGDLALTAASHSGCSDTVAILLAKGARIDQRNKQGFTALWLAVKGGHWSVVEKLLQNGADIDEPVAVTRKTPLMIAAEEGHIELLELLIERGASLESQDEEGFTALSWACLRGRQNAAKCLIEHGANRNHADNNGRTPLDLAAYQGSAALVQYLLEQGANIEHIDVNGMRPLDRSIACRNIQVVQVFLRRGARLGPTTWAMAMGKPEIMVVLLNKLLEDGNVLYRRNKFQDAAHRYQYALRKICNQENLLERSAIFGQLRTNLLLNLSRCKRKLNELDESIDLASQAIAQKPRSYEGYYARSKSKMEGGDYNDALVDANEAMQKAVQSAEPPEVIEVLKRIQTELLGRITSEAAASVTASAANNTCQYEEFEMGATTTTNTHDITDL